MATTHPLNDPQDVINDKVALLDAAGTLMSGQGDTVRNIELLGTGYGHLSDCNVNTTMETIADSAIDLGLDLLTDNSAIWAQHTADDKDTAFMNLAEAHARNWLAAADAKSAARSYRCAREALAMTQMRGLIQDLDTREHEYSSDEIMAITRLFKVTDVPEFPWTVILLLTKSSNKDLAALHAQSSLQSHSIEPTHRAQLLKLLAYSQWCLADFDAALATITTVSDELAKMPPQLMQEVLVTKARIEVKLGRYKEAVESYEAARTACSNVPVSGDILQDAFTVSFAATEDRHDNTVDAQVISMVEGWSPLERLAWMTWNYGDVVQHHHIDFARACRRAGRTSFMIGTYKATIALLDNVNSGAPMRRELAIAHKEVSGDLDAAKALLNEILDSKSNGESYRFTNEDPATTMVTTINIMADAIYEQFRTTSDRLRKAGLILEMRGLTSRPLARAVSSWSSMVNHYSIVLAKILRKMGPRTEFEDLLRTVFDISYNALTDAVSWNDIGNINSLAQVLSALGGLEREARILLSAQFSRLDPAIPHVLNDKDVTSEAKYSVGQAQEDEGDINSDACLTCDGECRPPMQRWAWNGHSFFSCMTCFDKALCEECFRKREACMEDGINMAGAVYCAPDHQHIKGPIEGWRGIKDGIMFIDGDDPVSFSDWLRQLKDEKWEAAWDCFWLAEY